MPTSPAARRRRAMQLALREIPGTGTAYARAAASIRRQQRRNPSAPPLALAKRAAARQRRSR